MKCHVWNSSTLVCTMYVSVSSINCAANVGFIMGRIKWRCHTSIRTYFAELADFMMQEVLWGFHASSDRISQLLLGNPSENQTCRYNLHAALCAMCVQDIWHVVETRGDYIYYIYQNTQTMNFGELRVSPISNPSQFTVSACTFLGWPSAIALHYASLLASFNLSWMPTVFQKFMGKGHM